MRTLGGVILGLLLFFPGITFLRWLLVYVLGVYDALTVTDGCLVMIMVLLCVQLVRGAGAARQGSHSRRSQDSAVPEAFAGEPRLRHLQGTRPLSEARAEPRERRPSSPRRRPTR